jgi:spore cortex formation protein SpoVR/YcgB (stage V sporulation)
MYTSKNLWEMEPQTDILMFIDMGKMYLDNWNDEVVENINARYQFKDR